MLDYKLSVKNLPYSEDTYKSRKNKKSKILMIGAGHLLGWKIFEILKRDYAVVGIQEQYMTEELESLPLRDEQRLQAYITYQQIQTIIISSEFLEGCMDGMEHINGLLKFADERGIRVAYVLLHHILDENSAEELLDKLKTEDTVYLAEALSLKEKISRREENLVVELDCCYGFSGSLKRVDFVSAVKKMKRMAPEKLDDLPENEVCPVLADEVGLWLAVHLQCQGCFKLEGRDRISYRAWAQEMDQSWGDVTGYHPYEERQERYFSGLAEGNMVENRQRNCVFNMIYKFSHHESVKGENIGAFRYGLGQSLAQSIPEEVRKEIDFVTPVPKTGMYYAMGLAAQLSVPYIQAIDKTSSRLRSFQIKSADVRKEILWDKLRVIPTLLERKNVAVVDEAIFTGTTLKVVCEMLRECKVGKIYLCIPTPRCRYHCDYLVLPKRDMLLEYMNESMLTEYFDVEGVFFQEDGCFLEKTQEFGHICADCFLGRDLG